MLRGRTLRLACGVLALLVLGLLALGGAASRPGGVWLGMPEPSGALVVILGLAFLAWWTGAELAVAAGLVVLPLALAIAPESAGLRAMTGPPLAALVMAAAVAALARSTPRMPRSLFFPTVFLVYATMAVRVQARVGAEGDEPHYLMVADSLIHDRDLDLTRDYAEGRYRAFHSEPLEPHFRVRGKGGEIYSIHAIGLSLLVLPAYALLGHAGASLFMAFLAALLAREIRGLLPESEGLSWALALSPPLVHYAGLIFTEVPAALGLAFAIRRVRRPETASPRDALAAGIALAFLPWLNVRYAAFPVLVLLYVVAQRPAWRLLATMAAPSVVSALAIGAYHYALYGFADPARVYGRRPELSLGGLGDGLPGLLLDQEFGLLVYAPLFAFAVPGVLRLARERTREALLVLALVGVVSLTAGAWPMWRGGFNPPARFLVPVLPALAIAVAAGLNRGFGASAALLVGWGLWTGLGGVARPELVHRDRDGSAPFFRERSGAEEWTRLLPAYVLGDADRHRLATLWGGALAVAVLVSGRRASGRGLLASTAGLVLAAGAASRASDARSEGRDAFRVLGRPALALPEWSLVAMAPAEWGVEALTWGPLYEPHRYADGATLAARVRVAWGRLEIETDPALPLGDPPRLLLRTETQPAESILVEMRRDVARLGAALPCPGPVGPIRIALEGGAPFLVRRFRLSASEADVPATR